MTHDEFRRVALRNGLVRWLRSGVVEQVFKGHKGRENLCARNVVTGYVHPLRHHGRREWYCREVHPTEMVRLGDLLPIHR